MELILGIDLGTTNSEVSVIENGKIRVIEKDGNKLIPSVVGIDASGKLLVGHAARNQALLYPERTVKSIKRKMGEDVQIALGERKYSPPEISAMILRTLKSYAEEALRKNISKAVITVPAFFNDTQREATRLAGELAGLEVLRIINEPTAASLVYSSDPDRSETLIVYDLGGGTFDVSVVRIESGVIEVLASHGDTHLGGDDFDQLLFEHVCNAFKSKHKVDLRETPIAVSRLFQSVEAAKKQLSESPFVNIKEEFIAEKNGTPLHVDMEISRGDYEEMILPLLQKTLVCVGDSLRDAQLKHNDIDKVILVGGASRTPLVHQLLGETLGKELHGEIDPDLCVTMGAAVQGGLINGTHVGQVLIDITPHTLGVGALSDTSHLPLVFVPLIKRNTPIPCSRSDVFYTHHAGQSLVEVKVYQGENEDVRLNTMIGKFELGGLDTSAPANSEILCRFDLDSSGILHVTATEKKTGLQGNITVENALAAGEQVSHHKFKTALEGFFAGQHFPTESNEIDIESVEVDMDDPMGRKAKPVGALSMDMLQTAKLPKNWEKTYADEVRVLRRVVEFSGAMKQDVNAEDWSELQEMAMKLVDAIRRDKKDEAERISLRLDDLLYYMEDSK